MERDAIKQLVFGFVHDASSADNESSAYCSSPVLSGMVTVFVVLHCQFASLSSHWIFGNFRVCSARLIMVDGKRLISRL